MSTYMCRSRMEKGQYLMMSMKKPMAREDYGGCVWPPRTYSCSFCGREFRSAQALGGHMNVHRRDRARLKHNQEADQPQLHHHDHILEANPNCFGAKIGDVVQSNKSLLQEDPNVNKIVGDGEVRTDLSVGLNSGEMGSCCKRAKRVHESRVVMPSMLELVLGVLEPKPTSKNNIVTHHHHEELDLELRLGAHDPQRVN